VWYAVISLFLSSLHRRRKSSKISHSQEVHILHQFKQDFYGARMNLLICGFIRPEYDYVSKESLIEDINVDIELSKRSLERRAYVELTQDKYLIDFEGEGHENEIAT